MRESNNQQTEKQKAHIFKVPISIYRNKLVNGTITLIFKIFS